MREVGEPTGSELCRLARLDPALEDPHLVLRLCAVTWHRAVAETLEDVVGSGADLVVGPEVEKSHAASVRPSDWAARPAEGRRRGPCDADTPLTCVFVSDIVGEVSVVTSGESILLLGATAGKGVKPLPT